MKDLEFGIIYGEIYPVNFNPVLYGESVTFSNIAASCSSILSITYSLNTIDSISSIITPPTYYDLEITVDSNPVVFQ